MEDADKKAPYRCLPLVVANQYGWEILSTHHIRAVWDGTSRAEGLLVENLSGDGFLHAALILGGVLTFQIRSLPDTKTVGTSWSADPPKSKAEVPLDGIVETDWTRPFHDNCAAPRRHLITLGEPICLFFPTNGDAEKFRGELAGWIPIMTLKK